MKYSKTIAGITIEICEKAIGEDLVLTLSGGEKPHIGCVVQAVPRPSLSGDRMMYFTSINGIRKFIFWMENKEIIFLLKILKRPFMALVIGRIRSRNHCMIA